MQLFIQKLCGLIEVKKIISLIITITLVSLAFMDKVTSEQFLPLATMCIGYYFGQSTVRSISK